MSENASTERDPLDLLVEEFLRRQRAGEAVDVEAYAQEHAAHAEALRELLPTMQALEQVKRDRESTGGLAARVALPAMQQLGDFRIVREIGRGGMGVVFEAVQESLSRRVALKVMPQAALLSGNQLRRFQREAQVAAQLHHSNIVPVFGSGETDGYHWYAMQFIDGAGLDRFCERERAAPPAGSGAWRSRARFVAAVGEQVASALAYAHGQGTLHRDVKPANLLLEAGGHVWVTDFGLAKALEAEGLTQSGDLLGTLQYMAPEQFAGQYDARSEVYALGATLYEVLALRPAYAGRTRSELMDAIRKGRPAPLRRACPEVPEDLAVVVEKAMANDPADRYASAEALQHDLQAFLEDRPIGARRHGTAALVLRWCRRNRALAAVASAAVVAALAAGVTGWVAYVVTSGALATAEQAGWREAQERSRAESNLRLTLAAFGDVFDALVGRDPVLMFEEDPDTGEQAVVASRAVSQQDLALLEKVLRFYDEFAEQNAESQSLRFETARAYRRVGVIQAALGELEDAAVAYEQALGRYRDVSERDVTLELAAVEVEYGQVEQRRGRREEAAARFRRALQLLEHEPAGGDPTALRFARANAHFQLARNPVLPPPMGRGGDRGRWARWFEAQRETSQRHLDEARAVLGAMSAEDRGKVEVRALEARCHLVAAALAADNDTLQAAEREAGLQRFRELVAAQPTATLLRLELCNALLGPGAPASERRALLVEASAHADELHRQQPDNPECHVLRARIGRELGGLLLSEARGQEGEQRLRTLRDAEAQLRLAVGEAPLPIRGPSGGRVLLQAVRAAGQLDLVLRSSGREADAEAEAERFFAGLRATLTTGTWIGRVPLRAILEGRRGGPQPRPAFGFSPEFQRRLAEFIASLPADSGRERDRPGGRGPDRRRGGR